MGCGGVNEFDIDLLQNIEDNLTIWKNLQSHECYFRKERRDLSTGSLLKPKNAKMFYIVELLKKYRNHPEEDKILIVKKIHNIDLLEEVSEDDKLNTESRLLNS